jgi:hypothetical protein
MRLNGKKIIFTFFGAILFLIMGCAEKDINLTDQKYIDLKNTIHRYYDLEKAKKWTAVYSMRTPNFRQTVELETYVSAMEMDSQGWELLEFDILSATKNKEEVVVKIRTLESFSKDSDFGRSLGGQIDKSYFTDYSVWKRIDGQWYCKASGSRGHLSLNSALEE